MAVINGVSANHDALLPGMLKGFRNAWIDQSNLLSTITNQSSDLVGIRGESVSVNIAEGFNVEDVMPSVNLTGGEQQKFYNVKVSLDYWKQVKFERNDRTHADITGPEVMRTAVIEASRALANYMNNSIMQELKVTGNVITTTGTPLSTYNDVIAFNKLMSMRVPKHDRILIFGRESEAKLLAQPNFLEVNYHANSSTIVKGIIGERLGFQFLPMNVETAAVGEEIGGDITLALSSAVITNRDIPVIATTATSSANFYKGNILVITEVDGTPVDASIPLDKKLLVVAKDAEVTSTTTPISIRGGHELIDLTGATSVTVKMLKTIDEALGYQKSACVVVTRPSETLGFKQGRVSMYDDTKANLAVTLERTRGNKITLYGFDILYGVHTVHPERAARQVSYDVADMYV